MSHQIDLPSFFYIANLSSPSLKLSFTLFSKRLSFVIILGHFLDPLL